MKRFLLALQFLTVLPVRVKGEVRPDDMAGSAACFPAVGLIQGALVAAIAFAGGRMFHPDLAPALALLALVLTSGGLHLDGLSDTFDGLGAKGGRERKLEVMRHGVAGPMGVAAIAFALLVKYLAIKSASGLPAYAGHGALVAMPVAGKWCMVAGMRIGKPARPEGLGALFAGRVGAFEIGVSTLFFALVLIAPAFFGPAAERWAQLMVVAASFASLGIFVFLSNSFFRARFGGITGDTLGAVGEVGEIIFMLTVIAWSRHYIL